MPLSHYYNTPRKRFLAQKKPSCGHSPPNIVSLRTLQASLYLRYFMLPDQSVPFGYLIHARLNVQLTIFSHGILFFHQLLLVFVCVGMVLSHSLS